MDISLAKDNRGLLDVILTIVVVAAVGNVVYPWTYSMEVSPWVILAIGGLIIAWCTFVMKWAAFGVFAGMVLVLQSFVSLIADAFAPDYSCTAAVVIIDLLVLWMVGRLIKER